MITKDFDSFYKRLNPEQRLAVDTVEGAVMVIAGPGTGKTQILTLRIANILLKTDVGAANILALTFTESAVLQMRKRLVEIIGTTGYKVEINTFHGFCNEVIRNNPEEFPYLISSESITELEQIQLLEEIILSLEIKLLKPFGDQLYFVRPALSAINDLKKEGVGVEDFLKALKKQEKDFTKIEDLYHEKGAYKGQIKGKYQDLKKEIEKNKELHIIYSEYQKLLRERQLFDFNDMLLEVLKALEKDKSLLLRLQERFQYILVDEHQDTNAAQNRIVELLASFHPNPNLFVVGDEKQSIFRFQGASLENFLYFKSIYKEAVLINLEQSYRSHQTLLDASGSLIANNKVTELLPGRVNLQANVDYPEQKISLVKFEDYFSEYFYLASQIKERIKNGVDLSEIAIICRNNRDVLPIGEALEKSEIPYVLDSDQDIFLDSYIKKLIILLKTIGHFGEDNFLIIAMQLDFLEINPWDSYRLLNLAKKEKLTLFESLFQLKENPEKLTEKVVLKNKISIVNFLDNLLEWQKLSKNESLDFLFVKVLNESGFLKNILEKANVTDLIDKVTSLFEEIKRKQFRNPKFSLNDFLNYLNLLENHQIILKKNNKSSFKSAVRIMTAHKSKGLEFETVFLPQSFDGHWGNSRKRSKLFTLPWGELGIKLLESETDESEDERRLFYVALSRAKKEVIISLGKTSLEGKEQLPSQFIEEIDPQFMEEIDSKDFEKEFLSHKEQLFLTTKTPAPELSDKRFLNKLFLERGLSATAINNYFECPWKYFYCNLLQLPDVKNKHTIFGSTIHQALCQYIRTFKSKDIDLDFLLKSFKQNLLREPIVRDELLKELLEKGEKVLREYYELEVKFWDKNRLAEFEIRGVKFKGELVLNGVIDMIALKKNGTEAILYDFKTGRPRGKAEVEEELDSEKGNYRRQLLFYKILLDKFEEKRFVAKSGVIEFLEADSKGKHHSYEIKFTEGEIKRMEELILDTAKQIYTLSFWDKKCKEKDCQYCYLRDLNVF